MALALVNREKLERALTAALDRMAKDATYDATYDVPLLNANPGLLTALSQRLAELRQGIGRTMTPRKGSSGGDRPGGTVLASVVGLAALEMDCYTARGSIFDREGTAWGRDEKGSIRAPATCPAW